MDNPVFSLDYYKIVRVPTSRGRDAIFIGIFTAGAHGNILFLGEESSSLVTSPLPSTARFSSFDRIRSLFFRIRPFVDSCLSNSSSLESNRARFFHAIQIYLTYDGDGVHERSMGASIFSRRKNSDELSIRASFMDHLGGWNKNRYC